MQPQAVPLFFYIRDMSQIYWNLVRETLDRAGVALTPGQESAIDHFFQFHEAKLSSSAFLLKGAAGTGKTFLIRLISWFLLRQGYSVVLLAPTGRAAKVITRRAKRYASTIHRYIYTPFESPGGSIFFQLKENKDPKKTYYIVDEASMVGDHQGEDGKLADSLLSELIRFIYQDYPERRLIMVGDPSQLPPIGSSLSPALHAPHMEEKYYLKVFESELLEVMRQSEASQILLTANEIRQAMQFDEAPEIEIPYGADIELLDQGYEALELYVGLYEPDNPDKVVFITYSNRQATEVNKALRHQLFEAEEVLLQGEMLMIVRNNYAWGDKKFPFIANGEMGIVRNVYTETYEERYGLKWMDADLEFMDINQQPVEIRAKLLLDLLEDNRSQLDYNSMQKVVEARRNAYEGMSKTRMREEARKDPYIHALQVKYGYAVTGHKAQGGQWENVMIGFEPMYKGMSLRDYLRWAYTAFTRAEEHLFLLNYPFMQRW